MCAPGGSNIRATRAAVHKFNVREQDKLPGSDSLVVWDLSIQGPRNKEATADERRKLASAVMQRQFNHAGRKLEYNGHKLVGEGAQLSLAFSFAVGTRTVFTKQQEFQTVGMDHDTVQVNAMTVRVTKGMVGFVVAAFTVGDDVPFPTTCLWILRPFGSVAWGTLR
jgi:hypothetical protein